MTLKNHPGSLLEKEYLWQNKMWGYQCEKVGLWRSFSIPKSNGNQVLQVVLLSHHNQQSNRIDITTAYEKRLIPNLSFNKRFNYSDRTFEIFMGKKEI